jgi:hypothetical protein
MLSTRYLSRNQYQRLQLDNSSSNYNSLGGQAVNMRVLAERLITPKQDEAELPSLYTLVSEVRYVFFHEIDGSIISDVEHRDDEAGG